MINFKFFFFKETILTPAVLLRRCAASLCASPCVPASSYRGRTARHLGLRFTRLSASRLLCRPRDREGELARPGLPRLPPPISGPRATERASLTGGLARPGEGRRGAWGCRRRRRRGSATAWAPADAASALATRPGRGSSCSGTSLAVSRRGGGGGAAAGERGREREREGERASVTGG